MKLYGKHQKKRSITYNGAYIPCSRRNTIPRATRCALASWNSARSAKTDKKAEQLGIILFFTVLNFFPRENGEQLYIYIYIRAFSFSSKTEQIAKLFFPSYHILFCMCLFFFLPLYFTQQYGFIASQPRNIAQGA